MGRVTQPRLVQHPSNHIPGVPRTPRATIRAIPHSGTPRRLATGDIRRVERLLMNSETTAGLLTGITRPAGQA
ncbi:MAG: hypothetical protein ACLQOO_23700 [Terriglobia bacterium]